MKRMSVKMNSSLISLTPRLQIGAEVRLKITSPRCLFGGAGAAAALCVAHMLARGTRCWPGGHGAPGAGPVPPAHAEPQGPRKAPGKNNSNF